MVDRYLWFGYWSTDSLRSCLFRFFFFSPSSYHALLPSFACKSTSDVLTGHGQGHLAVHQRHGLHTLSRLSAVSLYYLLVPCDHNTPTTRILFVLPQRLHRLNHTGEGGSPCLSRPTTQPPCNSVRRRRLHSAASDLPARQITIYVLPSNDLLSSGRNNKVTRSS